jgi:signal transduction histidine kinase
LHREFPERSPCLFLDRVLDETLLPLDGQIPPLECSLGLTARRFAINFGEGRRGAVLMGPYFTRQADREALMGRSKAADAALELLPALSNQRQAALVAFCGELATLAGSAVQAGAVKETFLANMSHELRTPLNGVMGMLSLVLQGELAPRQRQFLTLAMDASTQLLTQVNDLLELTHISSGRMLLATAPFGLRREIEPLLAASAEEAAKRGLTFTADIDADVPEALVGDAARLKQVLLNIIHNALKFTEQGSVTVRVSRLMGTQDRDVSTLLFSVRDTGIGIPPDRQRRIFERFAIGEDFLHKRHGRLGVGLAISKEIVEKMGGTVDIESTPGQGSVFSFTVLLRHDCVRFQAEAGSLPPRQTGCVILIAEEEPVTRHLVRSILEAQGHVPIALDSGQTCLDVLRQSPVDMLLVDSETSRFHVPELIQRIRSGQEPGIAPDLPIVILTPHDGADQADLTQACARVAKPVTRRELLAAVERACGECLDRPS